MMMTYEKLAVWSINICCVIFSKKESVSKQLKKCVCWTFREYQVKAGVKFVQRVSCQADGSSLRDSYEASLSWILLDDNLRKNFSSIWFYFIVSCSAP